MLGYEQVYDYSAGKVDWIANGLPLEGDAAARERAGTLARTDVVTCKQGDPADDLAEKIERSRYGFALLVSDERIVLGRVRRSRLPDGESGPIERFVEPGPSTVRPHLEASQLAERLREQGLQTSIVTTPKGRLIGVVTLEDLEALLGENGA